MARTYAFELSGEHDTLPRSEALALLEVYCTSFKEICCLDQCLIVKAEDPDLQSIGLRLAMTHRIIEVRSICDATLEALADAASSIEVSGKSYRIRAHKVKNAPMPGDQVENEVGRALFRRGYRADLSTPETDLKAIITDNKIIIGNEVARARRHDFENRRPHLKAFFYPGVLMPRMARTLVNISQAKEGMLLLDSFSGTGGILVEACLVGIKGIGVDVQKKLVRGAKVNLEGRNCTLMAGDARHLPLKDDSVDNAVLDIPYGRSAIIEAESKEELLDSSLAELCRVLKNRRRIIIVADRPIEDYLTRANFDVIENHTHRVHRSLTRYIYVCMKIITKFD